jgi:hypothetical protein
MGKQLARHWTRGQGSQIAAAGRLNYEFAIYTEAAVLLEEILGEEKAANEKLTELARASSNEEALGESDDKQTAKDFAGKRPANLRRAA